AGIPYFGGGPAAYQQIAHIGGLPPFFPIARTSMKHGMISLCFAEGILINPRYCSPIPLLYLYADESGPLHLAPPFRHATGRFVPGGVAAVVLQCPEPAGQPGRSFRRSAGRSALPGGRPTPHAGPGADLRRP